MAKSRKFGNEGAALPHGGESADCSHDGLRSLVRLLARQAAADHLATSLKELADDGKA